MARTDLSPETQILFFDFHWYKEKLWQVSAPIEIVAFEELEWLLDLPIWPRAADQTLYDLRPSEVLANPTRYSRHWQRIQEAELTYPLLMMRNLQDTWVIIDGYHRLAKIKLFGIQQIQIKRLPRSVIPEILRPGPPPQID